MAELAYSKTLTQLLMSLSDKELLHRAETGASLFALEIEKLSNKRRHALWEWRRLAVRNANDRMREAQIAAGLPGLYSDMEDFDRVSDVAVQGKLKTMRQNLSEMEFKTATAMLAESEYEVQISTGKYHQVNVVPFVFFGGIAAIIGSILFQLGGGLAATLISTVAAQVFIEIRQARNSAALQRAKQLHEKAIENWQFHQKQQQG